MLTYIYGGEPDKVLVVACLITKSVFCLLPTESRPRPFTRALLTLATTSRPLVKPPLTGRIVVVRDSGGINWKSVSLLHDRVASCVSGAVYIPAPEHAGTSAQQRQQSVYLVCQLFCSGEDGLAGCHGRSAAYWTHLWTLGKPFAHTKPHTYLLFRGHWAGVGGNHDVKADQGRTWTLLQTVVQTLTWTPSSLQRWWGWTGSNEHTLKGAVRQPAEASLPQINLTPHHLSLSSQEPLVHFSKSWRNRGRQRNPGAKQKKNESAKSEQIAKALLHLKAFR